MQFLTNASALPFHARRTVQQPATAFGVQAVALQSSFANLNR